VVECDLAKVEVAGSNPVSRSTLRSDQRNEQGSARQAILRASDGLDHVSFSL
jgi:hypothetical protein